MKHRQKLTLLLILSLLLVGLLPGSSLAQDEAPAESTEEPVIQEPVIIPTEEATPEPQPQPTAEVTAEPTAEVTQEPPVEITEEPTAEVPTAEPTTPPPAPPEGVFNDDFQDGDTAGWIISGDWTVVSEGGNSFLSASSAGSAAAIDVDWGHFLFAAQIRVGADSALRVNFRAGVSVEIDASGQASLLQNGLVVAKGVAGEATGGWRTLNIQVLGESVTVAVDRAVQVTFSDASLAGPGGINLTDAAGTVAIDDVDLKRLDAPIVALAPVIEPTTEPVTLPPTEPPGPAVKAELPGLSSELNALLNGQANVNLGDSQSGNFFSRGAELQVENGRVKIMVIALDVASANSIVQALPGIGGEVTSHYRTWIDAWLPINSLPQAAALPGVSLVQGVVPVEPPEPVNDEPVVAEAELETALASTFDTGHFVTEGVRTSGANKWHQKGWAGQGVKIGIVDQFKNYTVAQSLGELPSSISVMGALDLSGPHGTAVAEIIHDMAPLAELTFASPGTVTEMANDIESLAAAGMDVISSSLGFFFVDPGDGSGEISQAISTAFNTYGTVYVQSAGNYGQLNWDGPFRDTDGDGWHEFLNSGASFGSTPDTSEVIQLNNGKPFSCSGCLNFQMRWNAWPTTNQDYDLYVVGRSGSGWSILGGSTGIQNGSQPPLEGIFGSGSGYLGLSAYKYSATGNQILDIQGRNAPVFKPGFRDRSLNDGAAARYAFSVAALDAKSKRLESYSSAGPAMGPGGNLAPGNDQPRISGYANVSTWAYGKRGPGSFNGTSAATPHVAGAAALVLSAYPGFTPQQVWDFLEGRARDAGARGYDNIYGAGRLTMGKPPLYGRPDLLNPGRNAYTNDNTPLLQWTNAGFGGLAPTYQIQVDDDRRFRSSLLYLTMSLNQTVGTTLADGNYWWRVRATSTYQDGKWSRSYKFTVDTIPPEAPTLVKPKPGQNQKSRPKFSWRAVRGAFSYEIQIDNNSNFSSPEDSSSGRRTSYKAISLPPGTYYWRVRAIDRAGNVGPWSDSNFVIP